MRYSAIQNIEGLQIIPISDKKIPLVPKWEQTKTKHDISKCYGVGIVCGAISENLECIDVDLKYDITGTIFTDYKKTISSINPELLKKLVVQKTVSGGYHLIYRCENIEGNKKLAQRYATEAEKLKGEKIKVLFETRGEHGYIACYPTPGYELVYGTFDKIQTITPDERETLFSVAYSFNEVVKEYRPPVVAQKKQIKGLTPSEDFNQRGDVIALLQEYGWTAVGKKGSKILVKRPGDSKTAHSGNYDEERNRFSVFTTSTEFEAQTPYMPYAVYCLLKCNGDFTKVPEMLRADGYGDPIQEAKEIAIQSIIDTSDEDLSFLATAEDYEDYLNKWRTGTFEMGKSTGIPTLDNHFLFKEGNLVIINGIDNVGKSSVAWYLSMLAAVFHGWKSLIFSSENRIGGVVRKLIEFYWSEPIDSMSEEKFKTGKKFVRENFDIIKTSEKMFNYQDILNMAAKALKKKTYKILLMDPYNSLKIDIPAKSKQGVYDYHYEAASVLQLFGRKYNISIYLNCHVGSQAARNKDKDGFTKAPQKEDTEMGVMFANKADEFITIHRVTQHKNDWMFTEFHVRKVKETETGGRVTFFASPIDLKMVNNYSGFETVPSRTNGLSGYNPIVEFHNKKSKVENYNPNSSIEPNRAYEDELVPQYDEPGDDPF